ncbi:MvaI/BcnI family restriction endonuclease [Solibacillus sp. FSL R7-0668]|uniref:MvaI/BcnI family restriction endonuclease n=1 Tax=Solibacillus sp. FSL R7-0668 TaxID=2921688 RepID=UPI0030FA972A
MIFVPNEIEQEKINAIQKVYNKDYALVRLTSTMLEKSIIDASFLIRNMLRKNGIVDFQSIEQGKKNRVLKDSFILSKSEIIKVTSSFYRPNTKKGDPRFWLYKFKDFVDVNTLIYLTPYKNHLMVIVLDDYFDSSFINKVFSSETIQLKAEILEKINIVREKGFVYSVSDAKKIAPKDVGDTFEREMGIEPNIKPTADYKGKVELKAKRKASKTKDSLFSQVPDWSASKIKSAGELILKYGYPHSKKPEYLALYVTVSNIPNKQGFYLKVEEEKEQLVMCDKHGTALCVWHFKDIEAKLLAKHPSTLWIMADEESINNHWHFKYTDAVLTRNPIFTSFLSLIEQGKITYDWRAKVKPDRTGYDDHGNGFRLNPKYRNELFAEEEII